MNTKAAGAVRRAAVLPSLALVAICLPLHAQELDSLPPTVDRAELIALVEGFGQSHPALPPSAVAPAAWSEVEFVGSSDRRCVTMPPDGPVRSGDFGLAFWGFPFEAGKYQKISWTPVGDYRDMAVYIRGRMVSDPESVVERRSSQLGRSVRTENTGGEDRTWFFPAGLAFPAAGEWVVVATSGANWGCFVFTVGRATQLPPN